LNTFPGRSASYVESRNKTAWLALAHRKLDQAVLEAYGWPHDLEDEEILERLLALNLEQAGA